MPLRSPDPRSTNSSQKRVTRCFKSSASNVFKTVDLGYWFWYIKRLRYAKVMIIRHKKITGGDMG